MLSTCAQALARQTAQRPLMGAVCAVARHVRPWLPTVTMARRSMTAPCALALEREDDALALEQQQQQASAPPPAVVQPHPPALVTPHPEYPPPCAHSPFAHHHHESGAAAVPAVAGHIHSVESFSAVDGPGVRMVVFEQGCAMRCAFCSNPDTWSASSGESISSKDIAAQLRSVAPYLRPGGGGVTCSGGEALLQPAFTAAVFQEAHALGLTTCLDTTGQGTKHGHWDTVLPHTDMVLFCIKHLNPEKYAALTGLRQVGALRFAAELKARGIPHWLRYVLIPGHTDDDDGINRLVDFCLGQQPALQGVELLPYHRLGVNKWEALGLNYPLAGVETPPVDKVMEVVAKLEAAGLNVICDAKRLVAQRAAHKADL